MEIAFYKFFLFFKLLSPAETADKYFYRKEEISKKRIIVKNIINKYICQQNYGCNKTEAELT